MAWSGYSNAGLRITTDTAMQFAGVGMPVYLRMMTQTAEIASTEDFAQFGFQASASGTQVTQDILITPPPIVEPVSMRDIGLNSAQLAFGATRFTVSHTFVLTQQRANSYVEPNTGLPDFFRVFRDQSVVGIYYNSRLGKIVSITHRDIQQSPWVWDLIVNYAEQPSQG